MNALVTPETELEKRLQLESTGPYPRLHHANGESATLPGQPRIELNSPDLDSYLKKEHLTPDLDRLAPRLWLVSTPRSSHISPLHHQAARGRSIVVVEHPQLHLVWSYDRIFVKPIPRYLLSHAFWEYIRSEDELYQAAASFLRSYSYLIRYETDFRLATSEALGLIPTDGGTEPISFERFARFIAPFAQLRNGDVNPRYRYGELRLTRLNICARLFLGKLTFHHIEAQWSSYFGRHLAPMLSVFGIFSIILSAMQVEVAIQSSPQVRDDWSIFSKVSQWFSVLTIILTAICILFLIALLIFMFVHDIWFARSVLRLQKETSQSRADFKSGII